jgi:hypothetical protein
LENFIADVIQYIDHSVSFKTSKEVEGENCCSNICQLLFWKSIINFIPFGLCQPQVSAVDWYFSQLITKRKFFENKDFWLTGVWVVVK